MRYFLLMFVVVIVFNACADEGVRAQVVLTPRAGTPCMSACDDTASPSCQNCCRTVTHEKDWGCQGTYRSPTTASCCSGDWDATCWNVASAANNDHACNQCVQQPVTGMCTGNLDCSTDVDCTSGDGTNTANTQNKGSGQAGTDAATCCEAVTANAVNNDFTDENLKNEVTSWNSDPAASEGRTGPIAVRHLVS